MSNWQAGEVVRSTTIDNLGRAVEKNGVLTGLAVSENATPNMSVNVAVGSAFANATYRNFASQTNVALDASHATLDRLDLIILNSAGTLTKVTGTAASPPNPPDLPSGAILLAIVEVDATVTAIYDADIQDWRLLLGTIEKEMVSTDLAVLSQDETISGDWDVTGILDMKNTLRVSAGNKISLCYSGETEVGSIYAVDASTIILAGNNYRIGGGYKLEFGDGVDIRGQIRAASVGLVVEAKSENIRFMDDTNDAVDMIVEASGGGPIYGGLTPDGSEDGLCGASGAEWYQAIAKEMYDDDGNLGSYSERDDLADLRAITEWRDPQKQKLKQTEHGDPVWNCKTLPPYLKSKLHLMLNKGTSKEGDGYINNGAFKGWVISLFKKLDENDRAQDEKITWLVEEVQALKEEKA